MKLDKIIKLTLLGIVSCSLVACASKQTVIPVKAPRHVCDEYSAHVAGIKDGLHREAMDYDYAKTNNCSYNDNDINAAYLKGYESGRQMK